MACAIHLVSSSKVCGGTPTKVDPPGQPEFGHLLCVGAIMRSFSVTRLDMKTLFDVSACLASLPMFPYGAVIQANWI